MRVKRSRNSLPDSSIASADWLEQEPRISEAAFEFLRLGKKAIRRPRALLGATVLAILLVGIAVQFDRHAFEPRLILRVTEGDRSTLVDVRPKRQLRDYVSHVVFSDRNMLSLIHRFGLYPSLTSSDPRLALRAFRKNVQVDVYRNYFLDGYDDQAPRSARIALSYRSSDPRLALAVTHALGELVETREAETRRERTNLAAQHAGRVLAQASRQMLRHKQQIVEKTLELGTSGVDAARLRVELADLEDSLIRAEPRLLEMARVKAELDLDAAEEQKQLALRFDIVDDGAIPEADLPNSRKSWARGVVALVFGLPLVGLLVGAFDPRVRNLEDIRELGLLTLGRIRSASGTKGEGDDQ